MIEQNYFTMVQLGTNERVSLRLKLYGRQKQLQTINQIISTIFSRRESLTKTRVVRCTRQRFETRHFLPGKPSLPAVLFPRGVIFPISATSRMKNKRPRFPGNFALSSLRFSLVCFLLNNFSRYHGLFRSLRDREEVSWKSWNLEKSGRWNNERLLSV